MDSTLGALIREARERARLTQADLARSASTSQPAIARYEAGQARPRLETAERCVEACGFRLRIELEPTSSQRRAAAEVSLARSGSRGLPQSCAVGDPDAPPLDSDDIIEAKETLNREPDRVALPELRQLRDQLRRGRPRSSPV